MRKGILEFCILGIISSQERSYPSDIIAHMKEAELIVVEGTLYPLLNRLKKGGLLDYEWVESSSGPPRKYYKLTEIGNTHLNELRNTWQSLSAAVNTLTQSNQKS